MSLRSQEIRKWERRERRAFRVRKKMSGTQEQPRLTVYRSHRHFHCQIIDDLAGRTLAAASTQQKDLREQSKNGGDLKAAQAVGKKIAEVAKEKGISSVVFDRGFYKFHGRVKAFAVGTTTRSAIRKRYWPRHPRISSSNRRSRRASKVFLPRRLRRWNPKWPSFNRK